MENELRIGNLIYDKGNQPLPLPVIVSGIDENGQIWTKDAEYDRGHRRVIDEAPIPLTPEWLERCGFKTEQRAKIGKCWEMPIMRSANRVLGVCNMTSRTLVSFVAEPGNIVMLQPIYDLHQIQNLYLDITGEQLTINNVNLQITS